jgi:hypothetical protein
MKCRAIYLASALALGTVPVASSRTWAQPTELPPDTYPYASPNYSYGYPYFPYDYSHGYPYSSYSYSYGYPYPYGYGYGSGHPSGYSNPFEFEAR